MITLDSFDDDHLWCGVFQGGGARGAAYAGALTALRDRGHWFRAVAGSWPVRSPPLWWPRVLIRARIWSETPRLLATVRPDTLIDRAAHALGWQHLVRFDSNALEHALDQLLLQALELSPTQGPVTFQQLLVATGIRLYVIVGDASTGVPVPFCAESTPALPVAAAVIASCSIPVLFPARYALVDTTHPNAVTGPLIRRLHDGGLWANFPAFAFTDGAFRAYHRLDPELGSRVLGFSLLYDLTPPASFDRFVDVAPGRHGLAEALSAPPDPMPQPTQRRPAIYELFRRCLVPVICVLAATALLLTGRDRAELVLPATTLLLIGATALGSVNWKLANLVLINVPIGVGGLFGCYAWYLATPQSGIDSPAATIITAVLAVMLITVGLMLHRVMDRTAAGLQGALSLLTGPTIRHAPWLDQLPGSHLVYLPTGDLTMLSFDASSATVDAAAHAAERSCGTQLDHIFRHHPSADPGTVLPSGPDPASGGRSRELAALHHIVHDHRTDAPGRRRRRR